MLKASLLRLCATVVVIVVSGCGSSVDVAEQAECPMPDQTLSSVEAVSYARCLVPGNDSAELMAYATNWTHDEINVGRFVTWEMAFRYEGAYYSAWTDVTDSISAGFTEWQLDTVPDCQLGAIAVMDSVVLVPAATAALAGIDPISASYTPCMRHDRPCLDWGLSWGRHPEAGSQAVIDFFPDWDGAPYGHVIFDDAGEVARVCSENACSAGQAEHCCE